MLHASGSTKQNTASLACPTPLSHDTLPASKAIPKGALPQDEGKRCEALGLQKQKTRFWRETGWW